MLRSWQRAWGWLRRCFTSYRRAAASSVSRPTVVVVLGGDAERERTAALLLSGRLLASQCLALGDQALVGEADWTSLPVLLSSCHGGSRERVFLPLGVEAARIRVCERATDTLTNATFAVPLLAGRHEHVLLMTSEAHAERARLVALIVFGSHGVAATTVSLRHATSDRRPVAEWRLRAARDVARAVMYVATGCTGRAFSPLQPGAPDNPLD